MSSSSLLFPKQNLSSALNCSDKFFSFRSLRTTDRGKNMYHFCLTSYRSFQVLSYILFLLIEKACYKLWSLMLCFQFTTKNIGHFMHIPLHFLGYYDRSHDFKELCSILQLHWFLNSMVLDMWLGEACLTCEPTWKSASNLTISSQGRLN